MAVTLFRKRKVVNNITIINGTQEDLKSAEEEKQAEEQSTRKTIDYQINAKIKGKMYGRRTVN